MKKVFQRLAKLSGLGLLIGTVVWVAAQSQVTSPIGSYLELGGQVTGPAASPTLNSTLDLSGNDQVRWTSYFQSKLDGPHESEGVLDIPPGHTWLAGSVRKPAHVSLQWSVNGQWVSTEPAQGALVTQVKWSYTPPSVFSAQSSTPTAAYLWGLGDAYRLIPYKDKMFVSLRNQDAPQGPNVGTLNSGYIKCRMAFGVLPEPNAPCTFPADPPNSWTPRTLSMYGYSFADKETPGAADSGNGLAWRSSTVPLEIVNYEAGEMFMGMEKADGSGNYVVCTNLDTFTHCGQWKVSDGKAWGAAPVINLGSVGTKYFMLVDGFDTVVCFDSVTRAECGRTRYPGAYASEYLLATQSITLAGRLFIFNPRSSQLYCHNPATNGPCASWSAAGTTMGPQTYPAVYPYLNRDGSARGVCAPLRRCVDLDGLNFEPSLTYQNAFSQEMNFGFHHIDSFVGSRMFTRYGPMNRCFDFATDSSCGFAFLPKAAYHPSVPAQAYGMQHTYTARLDPTRPNCILIVGMNGQADLLDADSLGSFYSYAPHRPCGGGSSSKLPDVDVSPAVGLQCDGTRTKVQGWDQVRLSSSLPWGGANGLSGVTVTLKDANGTTLPARLNPVRQMPYGSYKLDISDIPYADFPHLKVSFTLASPSGLQAQGKAGADVTWKGDPMQVCVGTQAPPAPDCQTVATLNVKSTLLGSSVSEALSVSKVLSPGGSSTGYSAIATATSARAVLTDRGPRDPRTQVTQGRWSLSDFSGDLWAFGLNNQGQIDGSRYFSAQAGTLAPAQRPVYVATPSGGAMPVKPLEWAGLTPSQQAALNTNLSGLTDTQGAARLDYLRGTDGPFRARGGKVLGPVLSSSPAMLPPSATLGLSEKAYPGYTAYRSSVTRAHPMALFGGNDGALHGYEVRPDGLREAWSFVPNVMLPRAANFADASLAGVRANPYFVDNIPMVGHTDVGGSQGWRAVAVMTYGRGARAITALDVTSANLEQGAGVLFEYSNTTDPALRAWATS
ncbi:pilus assembly protein [Ideonella paludis]|uniref:hypothetical protein n=1 Tax=Ideonella paludis TaxID=1233411 RepID=UPI00362F4FAE